MRALKIIFVVVFYLVVTVAQGDNNDDENLRVTISTGTVQGRLRRAEGTNKIYYSFQGIPYAQPPINDLRFRDPLPAKSWEGVLPTQEDKRICVQEYEAEGSEDCLYINVFTPNVKASDLPVMVWVYGAAFVEGSSKIRKYSPDYFLEEDVIIVTFNYRVGVFGFLSTEDSASPGNYGLKDQILALQWVRDNIRHFGGNPESVTVFGQSAGSASLAYLLQTPLTKGLFHRAIMQSGTSLNLWALTRNPKNTAITIGRAFSIDTDNTTVLINKLRKIDTDTLQKVSVSNDFVETILDNPRDGLIFGPTIEPELPGAVVTKKSHEILKNGEFNKVPCIVGFNSAEGKAITSIIDFVRPYIFTYDIFSIKLIPIDMNIESIFRKIFVAFFIKQKYFGIIPISLSDEQLAQFVTDDQFVRPIHEYVFQISKYVPVYFYRFSFEGILGTHGRDGGGSGVGHNEELPYMWKQQDNVADPPETDITTRKRLVKLWTNFARTSNPTPDRDELFQDVIWPVSTHENVTYLDIGHNLNVTSDISYYNIEFWKDLYEKYGVPPYDTY